MSAATWQPFGQPLSPVVLVLECYGCLKSLGMLASVLQPLASERVRGCVSCERETDHVVVMNLVDFLCQVLCRPRFFAGAEDFVQLS